LQPDCINIFFNFELMRAVSFILSIVTFCLAVCPCGDRYEWADDSASEMVATIDHQHSSGEQDACTPFCICTCCATHVQLPIDFDLTTLNPEHNTPVITAYLEKSLSSEALSIWQPPRLV
jgi:hypothetical protein